MATVFDVAAYILNHTGRMNTMKLEKLVYYAQAWSSAWGEGPLFEQPVEAWKEGPVVRELRESHKGLRWIGSVDGDPHTLTARQKRSVDAVLNVYGSMRPEQLSSMSCSEDPWIESYRNGLDRTISFEDMKRFYGPEVAERLGGQGTFLLKTILSKVPEGQQGGEVSWGPPVGREVW